ncbi:MAG TPA: pyridoxal-phosphate dependent enzyme [Gemmatimonadaceae bacterium]|nr:pyridoxal-phosphate dependent enzyme [Gemmatimonadaceae bacterium]
MTSAATQTPTTPTRPITPPRPTTLIVSPRLSTKVGAEVVLASETLQYTGSFKFRAAYNVASNVRHAHIITASSGNFGQAIAYASALFGKRCTVVMPSGAPRIKVDAVRDYGAEVDLVDVAKKGRLERLTELAMEFPDAYVASPYDDQLVIDGNASLGRELLAMGLDLDFIVAPIGGGGLTSGLVEAVEKSGQKTVVLAAEPLLSNDAAESFRAGHLVSQSDESATIADGARVLQLGDRNWEILSRGLAGVIEVTEDQIKEGMRLLFALANLKAEPTGALALGALLADPERFRGKRVCCVVSGGNADPALYASLIKDI